MIGPQEGSDITAYSVNISSLYVTSYLCYITCDISARNMTWLRHDSHCTIEA